MNRRAALASLVALAALPALAQQGRVYRVGFLTPNKRPASLAGHRYGAFVDGLRELGYVEGKNLVIEWRYAEEVYGRVPALASELANARVEVIVATGSPATRAAQKASPGIPIVMAGVGDPVGSGLVDSLARPGRNTTGLSFVSPELGTKWLELARSVAPKTTKVGVIVNVTNLAYPVTLEGVWSAARLAKIVVFPAEVRSAADLERAFEVLKQESVGAVILQNESMINDNGPRIAELARKAQIPVIAPRRELAEAGCVISYGTNVPQLFRRAATYVDKILKGAKAGELPVEQPTDFELIVNLKSAKAIGLTIPKELLLRADKVIE